MGGSQAIKPAALIWTVTPRRHMNSRGAVVACQLIREWTVQRLSHSGWWLSAILCSSAAYVLSLTLWFNAAGTTCLYGRINWGACAAAAAASFSACACSSACDSTGGGARSEGHGPVDP